MMTSIMQRAIVVMFIVFSWMSQSAAQQKYDLLLKGGHVIDPKNKISAVRDVAIANGKVAAVAAKIDPAEAFKVVDVSGYYVTPGLVDIHVHVYAGTGEQGSYAGDNSVYPDGFTFRAGVTTVADAGCAGWRNFEDFKQRIIDRSKTRVLAFINIVGKGMRGGKFEQDLADMDAKPTAEMALRHKNLIIGVKTGHYAGPEWTPVERAVEAGTLANIPVMVDFGINHAERPLSELVTRKLRPGDIYTHLYSGLRNEQVESGKVNPSLWEGRKRGVIFDVGHGGGSFLWRPALPAVKEGLRSRFHFHRPPHREHERRDEGHAQCDGQVSGNGNVCRRRDSSFHVESCPRDQTRGIGASFPRLRGRRRRIEDRERRFRLRRHAWGSVARNAEAHLRADD